jgi:hypothetical protein
MVGEEHVGRAADRDQDHAGNPDRLVVDAPFEADQPAETGGGQKTDRDIEKLAQARLPEALWPGADLGSSQSGTGGTTVR